MSTPKLRTAPGTSYFVTTKCWQGRAVFQVPENAQTFMAALFDYREGGAYLLHEFVVMPDHVHLILTPSPITGLEKALQLIKGGTSYQIRKARAQKMKIWQVGFYEWTIRDFADWQTKVEYIHTNPLRAKLVQQPEAWPFSSATAKFQLDPVPAKHLQLPSGAKAQSPHLLTQGLKPLPPEEKANLKGTPSEVKAAQA